LLQLVKDSNHTIADAALLDGPAGQDSEKGEKKDDYKNLLD